MFYKDKVVLVTGGTGFVGSHIIQELIGTGAIIKAVNHERPLLIEDDRVEYVTGDLSNLDDCRRVLKGVDYVFHAAGAVAAAPVTAVNPMAAIATNLILTVQALQAATVENVKRFLLFSSSTGYPAFEHPVKEEEFWEGPTHPVYFGYGWMRRYLERLGEFCSQKSDMEVLLVRPTAVYGPRDNFDLKTCHVIPALIRRAVEGCDPYEVWGTGKEIRDFLHVRDLARGCLLMMEKAADCDPINIGYGTPVTIKEIVDIIVSASGHKPSKVIFDSSKPTAIPVRMTETSKAEKVLGFKPEITLESGLQETVCWFRETYVK